MCDFALWGHFYIEIKHRLSNKSFGVLDIEYVVCVSVKYLTHLCVIDKH